MKLTAHGFSVDCGEKLFVLTDLSKDEISTYPATIARSESGVIIEFEKGGVSLNRRSHYLFALELTKKDVARLFVDAFAYVDFDTILSLLYGARKYKLRNRTTTE